MISIADQVFEELERDILSGVYERDEIITEIKLSEALGVSRTPIREALRRLEQEHIIEPTSKGARVIGISRDDIADICEIRLRLEGLAARFADKHDPTPGNGSGRVLPFKGKVQDASGEVRAVIIRRRVAVAE